MDWTTTRSLHGLLAVVTVLFTATVLTPPAWHAIALRSDDGERPAGIRSAETRRSGVGAADSRPVVKVDRNRRISQRSFPARVRSGGRSTRLTKAGFEPEVRQGAPTLTEAIVSGNSIAESTASEPPTRRERLVSTSRPHTQESCFKQVSTAIVAEPRVADVTLLVARRPTAQRSLAMRLRRLDQASDAPPLLPATAAVAQTERDADSTGLRGRIWPVPESLLAELDQVADQDAWAERTIASIEELCGLDSLTGPEVRTVLEDLKRHSVEGQEFLGGETYGPASRELRIAWYALQRRLDVWRGVEAAVGQADVPADRPVDVEQIILQRLTRLEEGLTRLGVVEEWGEYLLLDDIRQAANGSESSLTPERRFELAWKLHSNLKSGRMTRSQQRFLRVEEIQAYADSVRPWAAQPINYQDLLQLQEAIEGGANGESSRALARYQKQLLISSNEHLAKLGEQLENHYRNANLRLVLAERLLQRFVPRDSTERQRINSRVMGVPIIGRGTARTRLGLQLYPDPHRWRMAISAEGRVNSNTRSTVWPATFFNRGVSRYELAKQIEMSQLGLQVRPAEGRANTWSNLDSVETDLDWVPVLGMVVRSTAERRYEDQLPATRRQLRRQVASEAADRLDDEFQERMKESQAQLREQLLVPLRNLELNPQAVQLRTTKTQLIGRFRLAAEEQLATGTPRPREPSDCYLAVQAHESTVNNVLDQLELGGERRELAELITEMAAALGRTDVEIPEDIREENVIIHFDSENPIRVRFDEGRIEIVMRIRELKAGTHRPWRRLIVRAFYQAHADAEPFHFERDGYIQLAGARLRLRDQIALRGIFSKMFPRNPDINETIGNVMSRPELRDLDVSQFDVQNGWIGLALARKLDRTAADQRPQGSEVQ